MEACRGGRAAPTLEDGGDDALRAPIDFDRGARRGSTHSRIDPIRRGSNAVAPSALTGRAHRGCSSSSSFGRCSTSSSGSCGVERIFRVGCVALVLTTCPSIVCVFVRGLAVRVRPGETLGRDARGGLGEERGGLLAHGVVLGGEEDVELLDRGRAGGGVGGAGRSTESAGGGEIAGDARTRGVGDARRARDRRAGGARAREHAPG